MLSVLPPVFMVLALFVVLVNSVCILIDTLMVRNHKSALYYRLLHIWNRIDESELIDHPKLAAKLTLNFKDIIFGSEFISLRSVTVTVTLSIFLTTIALSADRVIAGGISITDIGKIFDIKIIFHRNQMYVPSLYVTNLVYDILTLSFTMIVLKAIVHRRGALERMTLLCVDAVFAFTLAVLCLYTTIQISIHYSHIWIDSYLKPQLLLEMQMQINAVESSGGIALHVFRDLISTLRALLTFGVEGNTYTPMSLASATTLVPTIVYLSIFLLLTIAKAVVSFSRSGAKYVIEKATEPDIDSVSQVDRFMPFTILGRILTAFSAFVVFLVVVLRP